MLNLPAGVKLYLANSPVDGRKSFNGLAATVNTETTSVLQGSYSKDRLR